MHEPSSTGREPDASIGGSDPRGQPLGQPARVLVIEDDTLLASTVCDVLDIAGYATECVRTLTQVEELLDRERFDLILADVAIPGAPDSERVYFAGLRA